MGTGASPNIGGAIARGFAVEGARLVCTDLTDAAAKACAATIEEAGGEALSIVGDVTDPDHAADVVRRAEERWGRIDILVNNAVWFDQKGLLTMPFEEYRRQLNIILGGAFIFTRAVAGSMIRTGTRAASSTSCRRPRGKGNRATSATARARAV